MAEDIWSEHDDVAQELIAERARQDQQWGGPEHDDEHRAEDWERFIRHQLKKAEKETSDSAYRKRLVNIGALAIAALQSWDRKHLSATPAQE